MASKKKPDPFSEDKKKIRESRKKAKLANQGKEARPKPTRKAPDLEEMLSPSDAVPEEERGASLTKDERAARKESGYTFDEYPETGSGTALLRQKPRAAVPEARKRAIRQEAASRRSKIARAESTNRITAARQPKNKLKNPRPVSAPLTLKDAEERQKFFAEPDPVTDPESKFSLQTADVSPTAIYDISEKTGLIVEKKGIPGNTTILETADTAQKRVKTGPANELMTLSKAARAASRVAKAIPEVASREIPPQFKAVAGISRSEPDIEEKKTSAGRGTVKDIPGYISGEKGTLSGIAQDKDALSPARKTLTEAANKLATSGQSRGSGGKQASTGQAVATREFLERSMTSESRRDLLQLAWDARKAARALPDFNVEEQGLEDLSGYNSKALFADDPEKLKAANAFATRSKRRKARQTPVSSSPTFIEADGGSYNERVMRVNGRTYKGSELVKSINEQGNIILNTPEESYEEESPDHPDIENIRTRNAERRLRNDELRNKKDFLRKTSEQLVRESNMPSPNAGKGKPRKAPEIALSPPRQYSEAMPEFSPGPGQPADPLSVTRLTRKRAEAAQETKAPGRPYEEWRNRGASTPPPPVNTIPSASSLEDVTKAAASRKTNEQVVAGIHQSFKARRQNAGIAEPQSTDEDIRTMAINEKTNRIISDIMTDFPGRGGGDDTRGATAGSAAAESIAARSGGRSSVPGADWGLKDTKGNINIEQLAKLKLENPQMGAVLDRGAEGAGQVIIRDEQGNLKEKSAGGTLPGGDPSKRILPGTIIGKTSKGTPAKTILKTVKEGTQVLRPSRPALVGDERVYPTKQVNWRRSSATEATPEETNPEEARTLPVYTKQPLDQSAEFSPGTIMAGGRPVGSVASWRKGRGRLPGVDLSGVNPVVNTQQVGEILSDRTRLRALKTEAPDVHGALLDIQRSLNAPERQRGIGAAKAARGTEMQLQPKVPYEEANTRERSYRDAEARIKASDIEGASRQSRFVGAPSPVRKDVFSRTEPTMSPAKITGMRRSEGLSPSPEASRQQMAGSLGTLAKVEKADMSKDDPFGTRSRTSAFNAEQARKQQADVLVGRFGNAGIGF